jgi:FKBP-type peptidyl-prolyl cis-trans isomerase
MKIRIFNLVLLSLLAAGAFYSCKKTSSQELRDLEVANLQKYVQKYLPGVQPTPSGLYYQETKPGDATKDSIKTGDVVKVFYSGFLIEDIDSIADGAQFDGSGDYEPFTFTVGAGGVIAGWEEAIRLMKDGGEARWVLPSRIGYSSQAQSGIPAYSPLVFYIKVYKVYRVEEDFPVVSKQPF